METNGDSRAVSDPKDSWTSTEYAQLDLNYEALRHVANYYLPGGHGKCTSITWVGRGTFHEIHLLEFHDGWTCIGRFTRNRQENLAVAESEIATRKHVRKHTSIPVPETYYVNLDSTNPVGAPFVLMEHLEGRTLDSMWRDLKTEFRLAALSEIAKVIAQLARLRFDLIGSLKQGGFIGQMQNQSIPNHLSGRGPFGSLRDYMLSFFSDNSDRPKPVEALYPEIREEITRFCDARKDTEILSAPYRLLHGDFDYQNMLFVWEDPATPPHLSGIIDWDYSRTVSLYDLCEYPIFIQDNDCDRKAYEENRLLREEFVRMLAQNFPKHSHERHLVRKCFRYKISALNEFNDSFTHCTWTEDLEMSLVKRYIKDLQNLREGRKTLPAYYGRCDSPEPDSELESDDEDT
ncbi:hypothetical protein KC333_g1918 [Hortaea werneckii]|nr:hypothetical protein KC333_g1918 [Hortaea werneckii]KAI7319702.1 hypothetical protein KC326_g3010 [Hortaea werneckii]